MDEAGHVLVDNYAHDALASARTMRALGTSLLCGVAFWTAAFAWFLI